MYLNSCLGASESQKMGDKHLAVLIVILLLLTVKFQPINAIVCCLQAIIQTLCKVIYNQEHEFKPLDTAQLYSSRPQPIDSYVSVILIQSALKKRNCCSLLSFGKELDITGELVRKQLQITKEKRNSVPTIVISMAYVLSLGPIEEQIVVLFLSKLWIIEPKRVILNLFLDHLCAKWEIFNNPIA